MLHSFSSIIKPALFACSIFMFCTEGWTRGGTPPQSRELNQRNFDEAPLGVLEGHRASYNPPADFFPGQMDRDVRQMNEIQARNRQREQQFNDLQAQIKSANEEFEATVAQLEEQGIQGARIRRDHPVHDLNRQARELEREIARDRAALQRMGQTYNRHHANIVEKLQNEDVDILQKIQERLKEGNVEISGEDIANVVGRFALMDLRSDIRDFIQDANNADNELKVLQAQLDNTVMGAYIEAKNSAQMQSRGFCEAVKNLPDSCASLPQNPLGDLTPRIQQLIKESSSASNHD